MRHISAFSLLGFAVGLAHAAHAQQPFERFGIKIKVATLSNGRYPEFFHHDSLRRIGSVVYNTRLHRIAYLLPGDSLVGRAKPEVTSRWMSPDPLAEKEMYSSPYVFVNDNPVNKFDPDGRSGIAAIDQKTHTVTVSSTMHFYGTSATASYARNTAASIQNQWNNAHGTVKIGGQTYKVRFSVTGVAVADNAATQKEIANNSSLKNNYVRVDKETNHDLTGTSFTDRKGTERGGNTGYWSSEQNDQNKGTTAAHEYGHGLALPHTPSSGPPQAKPDIMMTEDNTGRVPQQYVTHDENGTNLNVSQREVMQQNIDQSFTPAVRQQLQQTGSAGMGVLSNQYHPQP